MASSWGRALLAGALVVLALPEHFDSVKPREAHAADSSPLAPTPPPDPGAMSATVTQGPMTRVFDTTEIDEQTAPILTYVNDHTFIQNAKDQTWHLFGIWHKEPFDPSDETTFVHAVAREPDPAKWTEGSFEIAARPFSSALEADRSIGETHIWAPHVAYAEGRYWMAYQGGGADGDHASIRLAESNDLYSWVRIASVPLFEDICEARDPMLVRKDNAWALYYTRCESTSKRTSGVAYRLSRNLVHWTEPKMVLTLDEHPRIPNSGYAESPFVFERGGYHYLSVTSYPLQWNATMLYRSPAPFAFPSAPFTRLRAHAGEWLTSANGQRLFLTHAGPGQRGVLMTEISGI
jgi:hypothetical protein